MYKKKKKDLIKILIVLGISIILLFLSLFFSKKDYLVEKILKDIGLFVNNFSLSFFNSKDNNSCNDFINKELEYQNNILKETLELNNTLNESVKTNAIIINRDLSYWNDTITLNKGSKDDIEVGDAVAVNSGLIGKVIGVSNYNSVVRLLTSEASNKLSVKVETNGEYTYGLLTTYEEENNIYHLEGISETININIDSVVTTTGIGNNYPSGLVIGKVKNITTDSYDLAKLIEVTPSVNFDSLSIVTILKREVKA